MKKITAVTLTVFMLITMLAGCSGKERGVAPCCSHDTAPGCGEVPHQDAAGYRTGMQLCSTSGCGSVRTVGIGPTLLTVSTSAATPDKTFTSPPGKVSDR